MDTNNQKINIVLIANYSLDKQYSMLHFAELLEKGLKKNHISFTRIAPKAYLGKFFKNQTLKKFLGYIDKYLIFPIYLKYVSSQWNQSTTLIHILDHSNSVYWPYLKNFKLLLSCHDLLAIQSALGLIPEHKTKYLGSILQKWILANIKKYTYIACLSKNTQEHLVSLTHKKEDQLPIIPIGLHYPYKSLEKEDYLPYLKTILPPNCIQTSYFLHISNLAWYKNPEGLLYLYQAFLEKNPQAPYLVIVGPKSNLPTLKNINYEKIIIISKLPETILNALYCGSKGLIFPSLYEGLGLPILEAFASSCPVVCLDTPPMNQIGKTACFYLRFPKEDIKTWANAHSFVLKEVLDDQDERTKRICTGKELLKQYSQENTINSYIDLYYSVFKA